MFKIQSSTIHCSRGDAGTITLKIPYTDNNDYIKYLDTSQNVYWYDFEKKILYDENYEESQESLDDLTEQYYQFQVGDIVKFNIYERKGYDKEPLLSKSIEVLEAAYELEIPLNEEDTTFGEIPNKATTYWYDITLNEDLTIVCFNEEGAREFIMYPAKGDEE